MISRYARPELLALWSDQRRYDTWLDVELAACAWILATSAAGTAPTSAHPSSAASSTSSQRANLLSSDQVPVISGRE